MKITEHVYFYPGEKPAWKACSNTFLICGEKKILIDPGSRNAGRLKKLLQAMYKDGNNWAFLDEIWFTHSHPDHTLGTTFFLEKSKAVLRYHHFINEIFKSKVSLYDFVSGYKKKKILPKHLKNFKRLKLPFVLRLILLPLYFPTRLLVLILEHFYGVWRYGVDPKLFEKEEIIENKPAIQTLFLPGHTHEEMGFYIKEEKILIHGDLLAVLRGKKGDYFGVPTFNNPLSDWDEALESLQKIAGLEIEILLSGHGHFLQGKEKIGEILRETVSRMIKDKERAIQFIANESRGNLSFNDLEKGILGDWPGFVPEYRKHAYLAALLKSLKANGDGKSAKPN